MPIKPYDHTTYPVNGAVGSSTALRNELDAIEAGFDMVATEIETALTGALGAATTATTKAAEALTSANNADISEAAAAASAAAALVSQGAAAASETNAAASALAVANTYDAFDDRYLGAKAVAPTLDNDGNALQTGTLYWDTALVTLRGYNGAAWINLPATTASNVVNVPAGNLAATDVQTALNELQSDIDTRATAASVASQIAALVDSSPLALDTLNELAAALADDPNFSTTITNALALKAPLASPALTGTPAAPTAALGTNTTQVATTAFVKAEISAIPNASETVVGIVELATNAEVIAGTDTGKALTPASFRSSSLGNGQSWQNVAGSRAFSTTYTNSTGKPIEVQVSTLISSGSAYLIMTFGSGAVINGNMTTSLANHRASITAIVPNGETYNVTLSAGTASSTAWSELR